MTKEEFDRAEQGEDSDADAQERAAEDREDRHRRDRKRRARRLDGEQGRRGRRKGAHERQRRRAGSLLRVVQTDACELDFERPPEFERLAQGDDRSPKSRPTVRCRRRGS